MVFLVTKLRRRHGQWRQSCWFCIK